MTHKAVRAPGGRTRRDPRATKKTRDGGRSRGYRGRRNGARLTTIDAFLKSRFNGLEAA